jgi:predicted ATPase
MLKRLSIQNFKSLKDVTLDLQPVNLLIGPNNSGKTNLLKALEFFDRNVLQDKISLQKINAFRFNYTANSLVISLTFEQNEEELVFLRRFSYSKTDKKVVEISSSQINYKEGIQKKEDSNGYPDVLLLRQQIGGLTIFKPDPNQFSKPAIFTADTIELKGDCSNLIQFLFYLTSTHKRIAQQIEKDLAACVKDVVSFSTPPVKVDEESLLGLKLFDDKDNDFWADEVSEGVLYFLALLCIINQPNPPKLLLLEEPERGIHPRRIHEVMKFIFRLAEEKDIQIIMTTHHERVVDEFATRPEAVFVFDKDDEGATQVRNLQRDIIEPSHRRSRELGVDETDLVDFPGNLGENWIYGLLGGVPDMV